MQTAPFTLSLSKGEQGYSCFDKLSTNGAAGLSTNGAAGLSTNGAAGLSTNGFA